ncbi:hypothetical protein HB662_16235 [Roseomonas frigidaquae]|uniref:Acyltransferase family protein n=1 Tax=Falsiroseomonas frigidaquae TaxID=487318 RepID=A0ABX1F1W8_9PROT|nr:hypothetical protein [Falsiroseomonas frigidaquae]NKE46332.1 hypothetical protein [Falsiroseomonas frigidaquae]
MTRSTTSPRMEELDALRGIAALIVLLHHAWLLLPRSPGDMLGPVDWLLEETPLRVLALGRPPAVILPTRPSVDRRRSSPSLRNGPGRW